MGPRRSGRQSHRHCVTGSRYPPRQARVRAPVPLAPLLLAPLLLAPLLLASLLASILCMCVSVRPCALVCPCLGLRAHAHVFECARACVSVHRCACMPTSVSFSECARECAIDCFVCAPVRARPCLLAHRMCACVNTRVHMYSRVQWACPTKDTSRTRSYAATMSANVPEDSFKPQRKPCP